MRTPIMVCLFAGIAVYLVYALWILILAFRRNFWLGCVSVFFPMVLLVYVITNWRDSHCAFYVHLVGYALILVAIIAAYFSGMLHPVNS